MDEEIIQRSKRDIKVCLLCAMCSIAIGVFALIVMESTPYINFLLVASGLGAGYGLSTARYINILMQLSKRVDRIDENHKRIILRMKLRTE